MSNKKTGIKEINMDEILRALAVFFNDLFDYCEMVYWSLDPFFVGVSLVDSFTILVGFVAIGIPLSLQVISRATEKYKSEHLINYLSSWKWITPKRIYWASIIYFILALFFKSLIPRNNEIFSSPGIQFYAWVLIVFFLALVVLVGFWYGHLFTQAGKRPKEIYDALKK